MSEYKRLTNKDWKENYDIFEDVCCDTCTGDCGKCERNFNALVRLAELEDKIENRELVFVNKPFYSQDRQCWGIYQRVGDIVETCFMTEQQAKEYSMRFNTLTTNQYTFHKL